MNFEEVHNYYERLVFEAVAQRADQHPELIDEVLCDVACIALNQLPARYVRHEVELMFRMTAEERQDTQIVVAQAVEYAFSVVGKRKT
jgi:hypothetical protein